MSSTSVFISVNLLKYLVYSNYAVTAQYPINPRLLVHQWKAHYNSIIPSSAAIFNLIRPFCPLQIKVHFTPEHTRSIKGEYRISAEFSMGHMEELNDWIVPTLWNDFPDIYIPSVWQLQTVSYMSGVFIVPNWDRQVQPCPQYSAHLAVLYAELQTVFFGFFFWHVRNQRKIPSHICVPLHPQYRLNPIIGPFPQRGQR